MDRTEYTNVYTVYVKTKAWMSGEIKTAVQVVVSSSYASFPYQ